ncbi:keratinocyte differentiation factor 1 [Chanos chanos]|uniref:Keratinocyte differentiation factor 1 n=1 Tax=Chanos chanos TaxID=29144 RepID=A0A6J2WBD5_CHACN|nr:keratinocyte differentiation factor 1 [Chanos chanos]
MPGHSTGANHKSYSHTHHHTARPRADGYRQGRTSSRDHTVSQESGRGHHGEQPRHSETQHSRKTHHRHANGRGSETLGFIPGSADSPQGTHACGSCASLGWSGCKALLCCVLTCGLYGTREPCLPVNESSTDTKVKPEQEPRPTANGIALSNPTCGITLEPSKTRYLPSSDSFRYQDVCIAGKKVDYPLNSEAPPRRSRTAGKGDSQRPISNTSIYSREDLDLDDLSDSGTDIDSLITKKLLELYKLHQIEQLAKCTSDTSFSRKTNEISDLINSIAQDYNLEEQEAECRLVHGVIRISTRKAKSHYGHRNKDYNSQDALQPINGRRDGTLPDSGNETMTFTNSMEPEVKLSDPTPSDELARKMRGYSSRTYSSSSAYSPYQNETDSSGAPLLH